MSSSIFYSENYVFKNISASIHSAWPNISKFDHLVRIKVVRFTSGQVAVMSQPQSFDLAVITAGKHSCFEVHDLFAVYDYHHPINKTPSKSHFIKFNCPLGEVQLLDRRLEMDHQIERKCWPSRFYDISGFYYYNHQRLCCVLCILGVLFQFVSPSSLQDYRSLPISLDER